MDLSGIDLSQSRLPAEQAAPLPAVCYSSAGIEQLEIDNIFKRLWIGLGRADRLAEPGDFETFELAGQQIILLRDKDLTLRAFANTCRHRGARLLDGTGKCKGIRCPFHSWFYGLDGRLVSAPRMDEAEGFNRADYPLIAYRLEERAGFLFLCIDPQTGELDHQLGDFEAIHSPWPLAALKSVRRREIVVECNWKAFLEVFNEYYHLPFVHPDSIDSLYNDPNRAETSKGAFTTQFGTTEGTGALLEGSQDSALPAMPGLDENWASGARYTWIFPNMTFAIGAESLWVYEAYPLGPNRCRVFQTACIHPEAIDLPRFEQKLQHYLQRLDAALDEDIPALENQQRGLECSGVPMGRFHPLLEANVAAFARWYATV